MDDVSMREVSLEGFKTDDHKNAFDVWNKMSKKQFKYIFSSFEENKFLLECLNSKRIFSILDYGCATGYLKRYLDLIGGGEINYTGLDLSKKSIEIAKKCYDTGNFFTGTSTSQLTEKYDLVYSRDVIVHQKEPWKLISELASKTKKNLILRLRTRDKGETVLDSEKSCQLQYNEHWLPYIVLNYEEFINHLRKIGFKFIKTNRSYKVAGGQNSRYVEKSLYLKKTGTSETSIFASYENNQSTSTDIIETFNLEGHNYLDKKKYLTMFYKILNKLGI